MEEAREVLSKHFMKLVFFVRSIETATTYLIDYKIFSAPNEPSPKQILCIFPIKYNIAMCSSAKPI